MIFIKPLHQQLAMLYHLANHLSTLGERESEESECEKSQNERVTRASLSHLQSQLLAQEVGVMHQVSYSSSVSIFCQNEIKEWFDPLCLSLLLEIFHSPPPISHYGKKVNPLKSS